MDDRWRARLERKRFLRGFCVYDIDFDPDGHAWVLAGGWTGSVWDPDEVGPVEPYVITAEAVTPARQPHRAASAACGLLPGGGS